MSAGDSFGETAADGHDQSVSHFGLIPLPLGPLGFLVPVRFSSHLAESSYERKRRCPVRAGGGKVQDEQIARVVHEANRAVQIEQADPTIPVSPSWDDTDPETQRSAIEGVRGVRNGNSPEQSHQGWCDFKLDNGWTLGPVKDEVKKEHPLLVPYDELPASQRVKDALFVAIVQTLASHEES
jgi:hypothetical protein